MWLLLHSTETLAPNMDELKGRQKERKNGRPLGQVTLSYGPMGGGAWHGDKGKHSWQK